MIVTAALIPSRGRVFIAQRPPWKKFGLLWEFPGGKVEPGEGRKESLVREIREELCLDIKVGDLFRTIFHEGADFKVDLHAYWCAILGGKLCLKEHVAYKWVYPSELKNFDLTQADRLLVDCLEKLTELPQVALPTS